MYNEILENLIKANAKQTDRHTVDIEKIFFVIEHSQAQIMTMLDLLEKLEKRLTVLEQKNLDFIINTNKY